LTLGLCDAESAFKLNGPNRRECSGLRGDMHREVTPIKAAFCPVGRPSGSFSLRNLNERIIAKSLIEKTIGTDISRQVGSDLWFPGNEPSKNCDFKLTHYRTFYTIDPNQAFA